MALDSSNFVFKNRVEKAHLEFFVLLRCSCDRHGFLATSKNNLDREREHVRWRVESITKIHKHHHFFSFCFTCHLMGEIAAELMGLSVLNVLRIFSVLESKIDDVKSFDAVIKYDLSMGEN